VFVDRPHRLAGDEVNDKGESVLRQLDHRFDFLPTHVDIDKVRRTGQVVVPRIETENQEVPNPLAGLGFHADQRVGEEIVAEAVATIEIVRR